MIAIDTTVLIDEFRAKGNPAAPVNQALIKLGGEPMLVPAVVAGEFLDGAWMVSRERAEQAMRLLRTRRVCGIDLETASIYGRLVARLRGERKLGGRSQNDLWIAATAISTGATLLSRNPDDFSGIESLVVWGYGA
jgi:predicted nucleic acid-binding protein